MQIFICIFPAALHPGTKEAIHSLINQLKLARSELIQLTYQRTN